MLKEELPPLHEMPPSGRDPKTSLRLLGLCFLASVLINLGFALWLGYTDIYGTQHVADEQKLIKVAVYKPPIKQKPKPKPKPKIIPPKPKIIPKIVHIRPQVQPRPQPPHPAPPQHFTVGTHSTSHTAVAVEAPPPPVAEAPPQPVNPENTTVAPTPPTPPAPPPAPPPTPEPPKAAAPPPPPPPAPKPKPKPAGYMEVDVQNPQLNESSIGEPDTSDLDPPPTSSCIVSFEIDKNGHVSGARIKKPSDSSQFDQRCLDAIRQAHGVPAVQDHIFQAQRIEWTFNI